jgi:hypothetical protein
MAMLVYLLVVNVWGLGVWPMGRDYPVLAEPEQWLTPFERMFLGAETRFFADNPLLYQITNLVLLYAAMICIYVSVNRMLKAPRWLGTLAATLFMANPVHLEAVLNVTGGAMDLLGSLMGLLTLVLFLRGSDSKSAVWLVLATAVGLLGIWVNPVNIAVVTVVTLHVGLTGPAPSRRAAGVWASVFVLVAWSAFSLPEALARTAPAFIALLASFTVVYPLGLLPETTHRLLQYPALFVFAVAVVATLLALVYRKVRQPAMIVGLAGMLLASFIVYRRPFDPYHLIGGGQLVLATAFAALAACAVFARMNAQPKWHRPTVYVTTVLCFVLFGMKISGILAWREAGREVRAFQEQAAQAYTGQPLGIVPDWHHWNGAPLQLSTSISYNTLFSGRVPHEGLLRLNRPEGTDVRAEIRSWSESEGIVSIGTGDVLELALFPYSLTEPGDNVYPSGILTLLEVTPQETVYRIRRDGLPQQTLPAENVIGAP